MMGPAYFTRYVDVNGHAHWTLARYDFGLARTWDFRDYSLANFNTKKGNA